MMLYLPVFLVLAWLVVFTITDLRWRRVPNRLVLVAYVTVLGSLAVVAFDGFEAEAISGWLAGILLFLVGVVTQLVQPEALGGGDVKVFGLLGLGLGGVGILALLAGEVLAGLYVGGRYVARQVPLNAPIPLVPFLAGGSAVALVLYLFVWR